MAHNRESPPSRRLICHVHACAWGRCGLTRGGWGRHSQVTCSRQEFHLSRGRKRSRANYPPHQSALRQLCWPLGAGVLGYLRPMSPFSAIAYKTVELVTTGTDSQLMSCPDCAGDWPQAPCLVGLWCGARGQTAWALWSDPGWVGQAQSSDLLAAGIPPVARA